MKRFFILGALLGLFFASCSYNASDYSQSGSRSKQKNDDEELQLFSFVLDNDFVSTVQKSSGISKLNSVTVRIEFTGGYEATDTKNLSFSELLGTSFNFTDIPLNKAFTVKILVYHGSVLKYEAIKENIILEKGGENDLSMVLKSVFDFADETKTVVWNYQNDNYSLYALNSASDSLGGPFATDLNNKNFFFDAPGNVWYFDGGKLKSSNEKEIVLNDVTGSDNQNSFDYRAFACSREMNVLYAFGMPHGEDFVSTFIKYPSILTDSKSNTKQSYKISNPQLLSIIEGAFAVKNDGESEKLYVISKQRSADGNPVLHLFEFDISDIDDDKALEGVDKFSFSDILENEAITEESISDMLYQDGAVYVIVNCSSTDFTPAASLYNYGFILKYDTLTNLVSTTGLSKKEIKNTDIANMYCFSEDGKIAYKDNAYSDLYVVAGEKGASEDPKTGRLSYSANFNTIFPTIQAPETKFIDSKITISSNFYSPKKFIAIKPKKLVIADDGYAFYVDDNNALSFKNVNRIVTVDLETFALETSSESVSVAFDDDPAVLKMASLIKDSGADGSCYLNNSNINIFFKEENGGKNPYENCYLGIKNGDSN